MPLAANLTSYHICPASDGPKPHIGGPAIAGSTNVFIENQAALRKGDQMVCAGPVDAVSSGSAAVFINGASAARIGDNCNHGGTITTGCVRTFIG